MNTKKKYSVPVIKSEKIKVGVFGNYGYTNDLQGGFSIFRRRRRRRR